MLAGSEFLNSHFAAAQVCVCIAAAGIFCQIDRSSDSFPLCFGVCYRAMKRPPLRAQSMAKC